MQRTLSRKALVMLGVVTLLLGLLGVFAFPRLHARADSSADVNLVTYGDVQSLFHTISTGCGAFRANNLTLLGGPPCEDLNRARINFLLDQRHYCVDDWHLISISIADTVPNKALLAQTTFALYVDGVLLTDTQQTPIERVDPKFAALFGFTQPLVALTYGQFMAPEAISVGSHTLRGVVTEPPGPPFDNTVTFVIDTGGTGACLQS